MIPNNTIVEFVTEEFDFETKKEQEVQVLGLIMGWYPGDFRPVYTVMQLETNNCFSLTTDLFKISTLNIDALVEL